MLAITDWGNDQDFRHLLQLEEIAGQAGTVALAIDNLVKATTSRCG